MGAFHNSDGRFINTETGYIDLPLGSFSGSAAAVPIFTSEDQATFGYSAVNSEAFGIRWNNHATPGAVFCTFRSPSDRKPGTDLTVHVVCSKTGATVGDAVTFTIGAFNNPVGALNDADSTFGGATSALVGDASAKTISKLTRTLASADLSDGSMVTLSIKPTDGKLGTDDVTMHGIYITYERVLTPN